jgi:hypothetical protein
MFTEAARLRRLAQTAVVCTLVASVPAQGQARGWARNETIAAIVIEDGELAASVDRALRGAARLLAQPSCAAVLNEFQDAGGRPLTDVVASLALTPSDSLARMIFRDGRDHATCRSGAAAAFTGPGSRVVFVCGNRFVARRCAP